jgi:hypothetical protein
VAVPVILRFAFDLLTNTRYTVLDPEGAPVAQQRMRELAIMDARRLATYGSPHDDWRVRRQRLARNAIIHHQSGDGRKRPPEDDDDDGAGIPVTPSPPTPSRFANRSAKPS